MSIAMPRNAKSDDHLQAHITACYRMSRAVLAATTLPQLYNALLREAMRVIPVERASIMVHDPEQNALVIRASNGIPANIAKTVRVRPGEGISGTVFSSGEPFMQRHAPRNSRARRYRTHSFLSVPIRAPGERNSRPLGVINMTDKKGATEFTRQDLLLLVTLANQAAAYMHLEQLGASAAAHEALHHELTLARSIQQSWLPKKMLQTPRVHVVGACETATHVGGDYYDCIADGRGGHIIVIADVAGHDLRAALTMSAFRILLRTLASNTASLPDLLGAVNHALYADLMRAEQFVSCALVHIPARGARWSVCNAGHPAVLHVRGTTLLGKIPAHDVAIGIRPTVQLAEHVCEMRENDQLILLTDGMLAALQPAPRRTPEATLVRELSRTPRDAARTCAHCMTQTRGAQSVQDDRTMVVVHAKRV